MNFFRIIGLIVWKDGLSELRSRENIASMFFFALLTIFIFNFSLPLDQRAAQELAPGLIWIAFSFTGVIGLGRSFLAERDNDCLEALLNAPVPKGALYLGKLLGNGPLFIKLAFGCKNTRRIHQHRLYTAFNQNGANARPRRLHLVRDDGNLRPHKLVHQRGLASIGRTDDGGKTEVGLGNVCHVLNLPDSIKFWAAAISAICLERPLPSACPYFATVSRTVNSG